MTVSEAFDFVCKNERNELVKKLKNIGGSFKWVQGDNKHSAPWVTSYQNDGVWHDVEIFSVWLIDDYVAMEGVDSYDDTDVKLDLFSVLSIGSYTNVMEHIY